jgi:hypothetical protein
MLFRHAYLPMVIERAAETWSRQQAGSFWDPLAYDHFGNSPEKRWHWVFGGDVDELPFDGGRTRPLDCSEAHLYAQHWSGEELRRFLGAEAWLDPAFKKLVSAETEAP